MEVRNSTIIICGPLRELAVLLHRRDVFPVSAFEIMIMLSTYIISSI